MTPQDLLGAGQRMAAQMLRMMCEDLTPEEFHHQPIPGTNSPAWIVGHLAVTARRIAMRLGATELPALTEEYVGRFSQTRKPAESQVELGEKAELLALFDSCMAQLLAALPSLSNESLHGPTAGPGPFASNYGEALLFGSLHIALHCGQLSTIRRSLGKPPLV